MKYKGYLTEYTKLQYMIDSQLNGVHQYVKNLQPKKYLVSWMQLMKEINHKKGEAKDNR